ncbi:hypothetical protein CSQ88_17710 [Iodobacter sp. BJB302]|nr:hypothetical protein CSQ88_17710 [Iodobacter sp. BJB302]
MASIQLASLKHELTTAPPRLFLARRVFRGVKAPCGELGNYVFSLFADEKTKWLAYKGWPRREVLEVTVGGNKNVPTLNKKLDDWSILVRDCVHG